MTASNHHRLSHTGILLGYIIISTSRRYSYKALRPLFAIIFAKGPKTCKCVCRPGLIEILVLVVVSQNY